MARHYGTIQGNRGRATRCGSKDSGMTAYAANYSGAICAESYTDRGGRDCLRVRRESWGYSGGSSPILYDGPAMFPMRLDLLPAHLGAYLLPDEDADTLRAVAAALLARADALNVRDGDFAALRTARETFGGGAA